MLIIERIDQWPCCEVHGLSCNVIPYRGCRKERKEREERGRYENTADVVVRLEKKRIVA